jgi:hypothetical protein
MKKLITFAVIFALAMGGAFAVDVGGTVFGGVRVLQADSGKHINDEGKEVANDPTGAAGMTRIRLEGSGENDDGTFGGWLRFDPLGGTNLGGSSSTVLTGVGYDEEEDEIVLEYGSAGAGNFVSGLVWWKPVDQFKLTIGGNPDGLYGKEGYSGWMFYQMPSDIDIVSPHSVWGGPYFNPGWNGIAKYRDAFYGGFGDNGLMFDIKPVDMLGINIIVPYFNGGKLATIFMNTTAQVDVNLDFGNIALTFDMHDYQNEDGDDQIGGTFFFFFNLNSVDNLDLSVGVGLGIPQTVAKVTRMDPIAIGLAAKFDVNESFGLKARLLAKVAGNTKPDGGDQVDDPIFFGIDLLPYYAINDSLKAFFSVGLWMRNHEDWDDPSVGFHVNPYVQIGAEWGPTFYAGIRLWSDEVSQLPDDVDALIKFEIPIGIQVSF